MTLREATDLIAYISRRIHIEAHPSPWLSGFFLSARPYNDLSGWYVAVSHSRRMTEVHGLIQAIEEVSYIAQESRRTEPTYLDWASRNWYNMTGTFTPLGREPSSDARAGTDASPIVPGYGDTGGGEYQD